MRISICLCILAGVCLGMQLAVCEFARNVLDWQGESLSICPPYLYWLWLVVFRLWATEPEVST